MAFKTQETRFQANKFPKFPGGACPRTPLKGSRLRRSVVPPSFPRLATALSCVLSFGIKRTIRESQTVKYILT